MPGAVDDDLLAGEFDRIETPPGVEPAPERTRDPRLEPPECVWGECPDYAAWGDEPPTGMVCKELNSGEFDDRVYAKMTERIRGNGSPYQCRRDSRGDVIHQGARQETLEPEHQSPAPRARTVSVRKSLQALRVPGYQLDSGTHCRRNTATRNVRLCTSDKL